MSNTPKSIVALYTQQHVIFEWSILLVSNLSMMLQVDAVGDVDDSKYRKVTVGVSINPIGGILLDPELKIKISFNVHSNSPATKLI